ncbi:MAG: META domain-containing protein [Caldilineaceae bacterium]|nr:META domain-containing protein [Caldilineaceae bacterium]
MKSVNWNFAGDSWGSRTRLGAWLLFFVCYALFAATGVNAQESSPRRGDIEPTSLVDVNWVECPESGCGEPAGESTIYRTIAFSDDNLVSGQSGCNRYFNTYLLDGNEITFGIFALTRMHCGDDAMAEEEAFLEVLQRAEKYEINADTLALYTADGVLLTSFEMHEDRVRILLSVYLPYVDAGE